jgi:ribosome-binding factor A
MSVRQKRIANSIQHHLGMILYKQPNLQFISILHVDLSENLQRAKIYLSSLEPRDQTELMETLMTSKGTIMKTLAECLHMKRMPQIKFYCVA